MAGSQQRSERPFILISFPIKGVMQRFFIRVGLIVGFILTTMPSGGFAGDTGSGPPPKSPVASACPSHFDGLSTLASSDPEQLDKIMQDELEQCYSKLVLAKRYVHGDYEICNPKSPAPNASPAADAKVVAVLLDSYCGPLLSEASPTPLFLTRKPTLYVLIGNGGTKPSGTAPGSVSTSSVAPSASVDNPQALLLFLIAQRLQNSFCTRLLKHPVPIDNRACGDSQDELQSKIVVLPESQWDIEDYNNQCAADPLVSGTKEGRTGLESGTIGAILLNGSITYQDGIFYVAYVTGGTEANYSAEVVSCEGPTNNLILADNISAGKKTSRVSLFPIAVAGALLQANLTAKTAFLPTNLVNAPIGSQQSYAAAENGEAIGTFATNLSSVILGNPSSSRTLRSTFEQWALDFDEDLKTFCKSPDRHEGFCGALSLPAH
jgi:hypothetical protein